MQELLAVDQRLLVGTAHACALSATFAATARRASLRLFPSPCTFSQTAAATGAGSQLRASKASLGAWRTALIPPSSARSRLRRAGQAGHTVQHRNRHPLAAQLAVVRDGEPVGLVAHPLQQVERLGAAGHPDRVGLPRQVDLLELLGQRGHRDLVFQVELLEDPHGHTELALAPVHEQELRRVGKMSLPVGQGKFPLGQVGGEAAGEDLLHGRVVVVAGDVADLETPVLGRPGQAVLHHHHGAHVVGALKVAHVITLDAQRCLGQIEGVLEGVEGAGPGVVVRRRFSRWR